jgi:hypothetical protein
MEHNRAGVTHDIGIRLRQYFDLVAGVSQPSREVR